MSQNQSFQSFILVVLVVSILTSCDIHKATTFSKADSTAVLQAIFDFSNADFDTVAAISKRQTSDTIAIFFNKTIANHYDLKYKNKPIFYTHVNPSSENRKGFSGAKMRLIFWHFKKNSAGNVQVIFGVKDWDLICDYRLAKNTLGWHVVGLGNSRGKLE